jgi:hypothetical protein
MSSVPMLTLSPALTLNKTANEQEWMLFGSIPTLASNPNRECGNGF